MTQKTTPLARAMQTAATITLAAWIVGCAAHDSPDKLACQTSCGNCEDCEQIAASTAPDGTETDEEETLRIIPLDAIHQEESGRASGILGGFFAGMVNLLFDGLFGTSSDDHWSCPQRSGGRRAAGRRAGSEAGGGSGGQADRGTRKEGAAVERARDRREQGAAGQRRQPPAGN